MTLQLLFILCGVVSFAGTELAKPLSRLLLTSRDARIFAVRFFACATGAAAGYSFSPNAVGVWTGFTAGAFNASVVAYLKFKITGDDSKPKSSEKDDDA